MTVPSQDNRPPLAEAEEKVASVIDSFFDEAVPAYVAWSNAFELDATAPRRTKLPPRAQAWCVRVEMGIGKTHTAILTTAKHVRRHRQVVYAVPEHGLAKEVATKFEAQGIKIAIYRGARQKDPRDPTKDMCLNPEARSAAEALGIGVRKSVCVSTTGVKGRCPFADACGLEWQRTLQPQPQMWIVPSSLLMIHRPDFIPKPDAVVIDEQFHEASIEKPQAIEIDTLLTALAPKSLRHDERAALVVGREALHAAILANGPGPLSRVALLDHGISMEQAGWLSSLELRTLDPIVIWPNMPPDDLNTAVDQNKDAFATARALSVLWAEVAEFLCEGEFSEVPEWARLKVSGDGSAGKVTIRSLRTAHDSWFAPTLVLDATAPSVDVLQSSLGGGGRLDVVEKADITAQWSEHIHTRQILGASVAMGKVGLFGEEKPENVRDILRYIRWRAAMSYPADIGLITYKGLLRKLQGRLPKNITVTAHFGALAGLNSMERVAGLIVLGRPYIKPAAAEANAEVFGGQPVPSVGKFYPTRPTVIRLANGTDHEVNVDFHHHHLAEDFRWQTLDRGLLQAVGRLRPHRRTEHCWLDVITGVTMPIPTAEYTTWDDVNPKAAGDMADEGVILLNRRDVAVAFPGLSERQGRSGGGENWVRLSIDSYIENRTQFSPVKFTYRRQDARGPASTGYLLPAILPEKRLRDWLEGRLDSPVSLEVERRTIHHPTGLAEWEPATMPFAEVLQVIEGWLGELAEANDG